MGRHRALELLDFRKSSTRGLIAALILFVGLVADTYTTFLPRALASIVHNLGGIAIATTAIFVCFRLSDLLRWENPTRAMAWRLVATAGAVACVSYLVRFVVIDVFRISQVDSILLWFEVAWALLAAAGIGTLVFSWPIAGRLRLLLDSVIATSSVAVISWYFVIANLWHSEDGSLIDRVLAIAQPAADTMLVFVAVIALICASGVRRLSGSVALLTSGGLVMGLGAMSSHIAAQFSFWGTLHLGHVLTLLGWTLVVSAAACGAHSAERMRDITEELRTSTNAVSPLSAAGPYAVAALAFGLVAVREVQTQGTISVPVFVLTCVLMSLVVARQVLTLHENQQLALQVAAFNRDLEQVVERRTSQLQSLYSLAKSIGNSLDLESVIRHSMDHAQEALNADTVVLNLTPFAFSAHTPINQFVRLQGDEGNAWALDQLDILEPLWQAAAGTLHNPVFTGHTKYVIAPVSYKSKAFGWIALMRQDQAFDKAEIALLEGLGMEIATALENARLYEIARQMADIDSVSGLLNHRAAQQRCEFAFRHAKETGEPLSVLMIDVNNFKFFNDTYGHLAGDQVLKSIARILKETVRPHDVPARYGGDEFLVLLPNTKLEDVPHIVARIEAKILVEGYPEPGSDRVIPYALSIGYASFPEEAASRHELISMADKNMYRAKRAAQNTAPTTVRSKTRSESSPEGFDLLDSMITAVDNKDYYTRAHSEEVTEYSLWIAEELGLSEEAQRTIRLAALLHDVGKIGIPDEILRKPGHLTDEEFEVMKQHPVVGAFMVSNIPGLADIVPGVKHHHERWDGGGYPDKLAGEAIPLLARIIAVPDAFSAMTTDRPYRKGMNWEVALDRVRQGSGSHFDPKVVSAFERAILKRRSQELQTAA